MEEIAKNLGIKAANPAEELLLIDELTEFLEDDESENCCEKVKTLKQRISKLEEEKDSHDLEIKKCKKDLQDYDKQIRILKKKCSDTESKISSIDDDDDEEKEKFKKILRDLEDDKNRIRDDKNKTAKEIQKCHEKSVRDEQTITELKKNLNELSSQIQILKERYEREIERLNNQIQDLLSTPSSDDSLNKCRKQLEDANNRVRELTNTLNSEKMTIMKEKTDCLEEKEVLKKTLRNCEESSNERIERMQNEIELLKRSLEDCSENSNERIENIKKQKEDLEEHITILREEYERRIQKEQEDSEKRLKKEKDDAERQLMKEKSKSEKEQQKCEERIQREKEDAGERIKREKEDAEERIKREKEEYEERIKREREEYEEQLQKEKDDCEKRIQELTKQISVLSSSSLSNDDKVGKLQKLLDESNGKISDLAKRIKELKESCKIEKTEIEKISREEKTKIEENFLKEKAELQEKIHVAEEGKRQCEDSINKLEETFEEKEERLKKELKEECEERIRKEQEKYKQIVIELEHTIEREKIIKQKIKECEDVVKLEKEKSKELEQCKEREERIRNSIDECEDRIKKENEKYKDIVRELEVFKDREKRLKEECEERIQQEKDKIQNDIKREEKKVTEITKQISELSMCSNSNEQVIQLQKLLVDSNAKVLELTNLLRTVEEENKIKTEKETQKLKDELQKSKQESETEIQRLNAKIQQILSEKNTNNIPLIEISKKEQEKVTTENIIRIISDNSGVKDVISKIIKENNIEDGIKSAITQIKDAAKQEQKEEDEKIIKRIKEEFKKETIIDKSKKEQILDNIGEQEQKIQDAINKAKQEQLLADIEKQENITQSIIEQLKKEKLLATVDNQDQKIQDIIDKAKKEQLAMDSEKQENIAQIIIDRLKKEKLISTIENHEQKIQTIIDNTKKDFDADKQESIAQSVIDKLKKEKLLITIENQEQKIKDLIEQAKREQRAIDTEKQDNAVDKAKKEQLLADIEKQEQKILEVISNAKKEQLVIDIEKQEHMLQIAIEKAKKEQLLADIEKQEQKIQEAKKEQLTGDIEKQEIIVQKAIEQAKKEQLLSDIENQERKIQDAINTAKREQEKSYMAIIEKMQKSIDSLTANISSCPKLYNSSSNTDINRSQTNTFNTSTTSLPTSNFNTSTSLLPQTSINTSQNITSSFVTTNYPDIASSFDYSDNSLKKNYIDSKLKLTMTKDINSDEEMLQLLREYLIKIKDDTEIKQLKQKIAILEQNAQKYDNVIASYKQELSSCKDQVSSLKNDNKQSILTLQDKEKEILIKSKELDSLREQNRELNDKLGLNITDISQMNTKLKECESRISSKNDEIKSLEKLKSKESEASNCKIQLEQEIAIRNDLQHRLDTLTKINNDLTASISGNSNSINKMNSENQDLQRQIESIKLEIKAKDEENKRLQDTIFQIRSDLIKTNDVKNTTSGDIEKMKQQLATVTDENEKNKSIINQLRLDISQKVSDYENKLRQLEALNKESEHNLKDAIAKCQLSDSSKVSELEKEIAKYKSIKEANDIESEKIKANIIDLQNKISSCESNCQKEKQELIAQKEKENKDLQDKLHNFIEEKEKEKKAMIDALKEKDNKINELSQTKGSCITSCDKQTKELQEIIENKTKHETDLTIQINTLKNDLDKKTAEILTASHDDDIKKEILSLSSRLKELEALLEQEKDKNKSLGAKLDEKSKLEIDLNLKIDSLKRELDLKRTELVGNSNDDSLKKDIERLTGQIKEQEALLAQEKEKVQKCRDDTSKVIAEQRDQFQSDMKKCNDELTVLKLQKIELETRNTGLEKSLQFSKEELERLKNANKDVSSIEKQIADLTKEKNDCLNKISLNEATRGNLEQQIKKYEETLSGIQKESQEKIDKLKAEYDANLNKQISELLSANQKKMDETKIEYEHSVADIKKTYEELLKQKSISGGTTSILSENPIESTNIWFTKEAPTKVPQIVTVNQQKINLDHSMAEETYKDSLGLSKLLDGLLEDKSDCDSEDDNCHHEDGGDNNDGEGDEPIVDLDVKLKNDYVVVFKNLLIAIRLWGRNPVFMRLISLIHNDEKNKIYHTKLNLPLLDYNTFKQNVRDLYYMEISPNIKAEMERATRVKFENIADLFFSDKELKLPEGKEVIEDSEDSEDKKFCISSEYFIAGYAIPLLENLETSYELVEYKIIIAFLFEVATKFNTLNNNLKQIYTNSKAFSKELQIDHNNMYDNILPYVRLRCDNNAENKRFDIAIEDTGSIRIKYDPVPFQLYAVKQKYVPIEDGNDGAKKVLATQKQSGKTSPIKNKTTTSPIKNKTTTSAPQTKTTSEPVSSSTPSTGGAMKLVPTDPEDIINNPIYIPDVKGQVIDPSDPSSKKDKNYPDNYLFGPFTDIFHYKKSNEEIAKSKSIIKLCDKLRDLKPVILIGYGASGSGKTSTLINLSLKGANYPGVMMYMCKQLQDSFNFIEVSFIELEVDINQSNSASNPSVSVITGEQKPEYNTTVFGINAAKEWISIDDSANKKRKITEKLGELNRIYEEQYNEVNALLVPIKKQIQQLRDMQKNIQDRLSKKNKEKDAIIAKYDKVPSADSFKKERDVYNKQIIDKDSEIDSITQELKQFNLTNYDDLSKDIDNINVDNLVEIKSLVTLGRLKDDLDTKLKLLDANKNKSDAIFGEELLKNDDKSKLNKPLGIYITDIMDNIRHVAATTNNPESSRSHQLIFVKFIHRIENKSNSVVLTVCDFAGVENQFNCEDDSVITKFKQIKLKKKRYDQKRKDLPYYNDLPIIKKDDNSDNIPGIPNKEYLQAVKSVAGIAPKMSSKEREEIKALLKTFDLAGLSIYDAFANIVFKQGKEIYTAKSVSNINHPARKLFFKLKGKSDDDKFAFSVTDIEDYKRKILYLKKADDAIKNICDIRRAEGWYINKSLQEVRFFIAWFISNVLNKGNLLRFPPFINKCGIYQCNPYYSECFGNSKDISERPNSSIISQIQDKIVEDVDINDEKIRTSLLDSMVIAVFNVVNLSQISANNPPPVPYIDITNLQQELQRLQNIYFYDNKYLLDDLNPIKSEDSNINPIFLKQLEIKLGIDKDEGSSILDPYDLTKRHDIKEDLVEETELTPECYTIHKEVLDVVFVREAENYINKLKKPNPEIKILQKLIDLINNINAVTTIGTMSFVDMVSKFGLNDNICNFQNTADMIKMTNPEFQDNSPVLNKYKEFLQSIRAT